jgi:nitrile hydratase
MRMPGYLRGKCGVVISKSPLYPFPEAHGHGIHAEDEPTYDVRFEASHVWPNDAENAQIHAAIFESYLELNK